MASLFSVDIWQPATAVYKGSRAFVADTRQSRRAKALYAATNVVTDLTAYKDWTTKNSIRDGPMEEDLQHVEIDYDLASQLARVYELNKWIGDRLSVANSAHFVNICGTKSAADMPADIKKLIAAVANVAEADLQNQSSNAGTSNASGEDEIKSYLIARVGGGGKDQILGLDMSSTCARWWTKVLDRPNIGAKHATLVTGQQVPSFITKKLHLAADGDTSAVLDLIYASTVGQGIDSLVLASVFAMILHWIHPLTVRGDTVLLDTTSVHAWAHHWSSNVWRLNGLDKSKVRFLDVVRKWTTIAQLSMEVSIEQHIRTQTILENRDLINDSATKLRNIDRSGYLRWKTLHSRTNEENERLIGVSVWSDFYRSVLMPKAKLTECKPTKCVAKPACGVTPQKIAEAAPKRVTSGKHYTVADSIRVNMLECIAKWPEWSAGSIFSKISGMEPKCFFSGADYVATDPKSRVVMIYPADDSWVSSKLLKCRSPISATDAHPEARLKASVFAAMLKDGVVTKRNYDALRAGFKESLDAGIQAGRNIARKELLQIEKLSVLEARVQRLIPKGSIATIVRELIDDLLGEENLDEISLKTTRRNKCYFERFYDRGVEDGFPEFVVDRKVLIENCFYWTKTPGHPYSYLKLNGDRAIELDVSNDGRWHLLEFYRGGFITLFSKPAPLGTRLGDYGM